MRNRITFLVSIIFTEAPERTFVKSGAFRSPRVPSLIILRNPEVGTQILNTLLESCGFITGGMTESMAHRKDKDNREQGERQKEITGADSFFPVPANRQAILKDFHGLSGAEIMNRILEQENPRSLLRSLPYEDFFWIIKKVGEDDCLPLLQLASTSQWEYLLDIETWSGDRLDMDSTTLWIKRLHDADARRLAAWMFGQGEDLAYLFFFKQLDITVVSDKDEVYELPEGFFSLDGVIHMRAKDPEERENLENIIRTMSSADFERYQALVLGLVGVLPAESEEELYRMRNVRLAEHGFLPREEAIAVYSPLDPDTFGTAEGTRPERGLPEEEAFDLAPVLPLNYATGNTMLMAAMSDISDQILLDRIRLEFAGLCNQLLSADGLSAGELDILIKTCRKAAGYLSLALERLCGRDTFMAKEMLKKHPLLSLFRVGFGLAVKIKHEAERWVNGSWFWGKGLPWGFWGEPWGSILAGLMETRPMYFNGDREGDEYKDFEWIDEIRGCTAALRHMMVLDGLLERLANTHSLGERLIRSPGLTYRPLLFNLWGRSMMNLEPSFSGISMQEARSLFQKLRGETTGSPYRMTRFRETFVEAFAAGDPDIDPEAEGLLRETLSLIWQQFEEEYAHVALKDLDRRYSTFITIL